MAARWASTSPVTRTTTSRWSWSMNSPATWSGCSIGVPLHDTGHAEELLLARLELDPPRGASGSRAARSSLRGFAATARTQASSARSPNAATLAHRRGDLLVRRAGRGPRGQAGRSPGGARGGPGATGRRPDRAGRGDADARRDGVFDPHPTAATAMTTRGSGFARGPCSARIGHLPTGDRSGAPRVHSASLPAAQRARSTSAAGTPPAPLGIARGRRVRDPLPEEVNRDWQKSEWVRTRRSRAPSVASTRRSSRAGSSPRLVVVSTTRSRR